MLLPYADYSPYLYFAAGLSSFAAFSIDYATPELPKITLHFHWYRFRHTLSPLFTRRCHRYHYFASHIFFADAAIRHYLPPRLGYAEQPLIKIIAWVDAGVIVWYCSPSFRVVSHWLFSRQRFRCHWYAAMPLTLSALFIAYRWLVSQLPLPFATPDCSPPDTERYA